LEANPVDRFNLQVLEKTLNHPSLWGNSGGMTRKDRMEEKTNREAEIQTLKDKIAKADSTRRIIEVQSDLFQRDPELDFYRYFEPISKEEAVERFNNNEEVFLNYGSEGQALVESIEEIDSFGEEIGIMKDESEKFDKLLAYSTTWQERIIQDEIKRAAADGKTNLLFPTGETIMKIEGISRDDIWVTPDSFYKYRSSEDPTDLSYVKKEDLQIGTQIIRWDAHSDDFWVVSEISKDGKFKAVPQDVIDKSVSQMHNAPTQEELTIMLSGSMIAGQSRYTESFDISANVDRYNPIYKFYEKEIGRYLQKTHDAVRTTDDKGASWWETSIQKEAAEKPVLAFGGSDKLIELEVKDPLSTEIKNAPEPTIFSPPDSDGGQSKEQNALDSMRSLREASQERDLDSREI
jgi:hypothetical protein